MRCQRISFLRDILRLILLAVLLHPTLSSAQSQGDLEKKRTALDKQIRTTSALIDQAKKEQRVTQEQLQLLESQIGTRQQLINTMSGELRRVEQQILDDEQMVASLKDDLGKLKEDYGGCYHSLIATAVRMIA